MSDIADKDFSADSQDATEVSKILDEVVIKEPKNQRKAAKEGNATR